MTFHFRGSNLVWFSAKTEHTPEKFLYFVNMKTYALSICTWFLENWVWNFFQKSSWTNLIFSLFQMRFLQATQVVKINFEIYFCWLHQQKKSSSSTWIFPTWFFKNQVQMDRACVCLRTVGNCPTFFLFFSLQKSRHTSK